MIRAASARDYLAFVDHEEPGVQGQVRAILPAEVEHRIEIDQEERSVLYSVDLD